jgi:two-component system, LytTR family, response regulator
MDTLRTIVVDDEQLAREELCFLLGQLGGVELIGQASNGIEALRVVEETNPDLVMLDVQMPGLTGFEVARRLVRASVDTHFVFVTAYDQHAIEAFEVNAVDYLLKPFDADRLQHAIDRARTRIASQSDTALAERLQALLASHEPRVVDRLVVRNGERFELVPLAAIDWVEAANNYVQLHCGLKQHLLGETLTSLERRLDPRQFLRVHRSRMVNTSRIVAVHLLMGGTYELELRDGTRLTSGRQYREAVQQLIRG